MIGLKSLNVKTIFFHVIFWIAVWFFYIYFFSYNSNDRKYILWFSGALIPVTILVTYLMVYNILPNYLFKKKYYQFALYFFYTGVFTAYSIVIIIYACLIFILKFNVSNTPTMSKNFAFVFILVYLIVGIVSLVYILNNNFKTISKNKELQNKILETQLQLKDQELYYLKKQIHPHFLFNTLNTIYGFALKQSKHTPDIILKLSNLLDYILYQVNKSTVSLKKEVTHIKEYIELEKIRFQDTLKINFYSDGIDNNIEIAPMLLIPFVENAFKHGSIIDGFQTIEIVISMINDKFSFLIKNTFNEEDSKSENPGIGIQNIKKRLELNFKNNYSLKVDRLNGWYSVNLIIFNLNKTHNDYA